VSNATTASGSLETQVASLKNSAFQIREQVKQAYALACESDQPQAYREALVRIRSLQDNLEEYVAMAIQFRGGMTRASAEARDAYDEAWAAEANRSTMGPVSRRREDFEGARERYARFDVKVFSQLRSHRQAEKCLALAGELLDEMWLRYRAVNATREDLHNILRSYAFESSLDR
jgi:hypothetical protein